MVRDSVHCQHLWEAPHSHKENHLISKSKNIPPLLVSGRVPHFDENMSFWAPSETHNPGFTLSVLNFVRFFCSNFGASRKRIGMPSQFQLIQTSATAPWMPLSRALKQREHFVYCQVRWRVYDLYYDLYSLVVSNIFCFPFHIWDNPSHWLSYFSRWLTHVKTTNQICIYKWRCAINITRCFSDAALCMLRIHHRQVTKKYMEVF